MDLLILVRRPDLMLINKKKRICNLVDFAIPADNRVKLKESEKRGRYLDLVKKLKNLRNIVVMIFDCFVV